MDKCDEDKTCLEDLKEEYSKLKEEFELPEFEELNEDFSIEKLADAETDYLIREIRKYMAEKYSSYVRFIETILNPSNSPMIIFNIIKALSPEAKEKLQKVYKTMVKWEIELIVLEVNFDLERELNFIRESYKDWKESKNIFLEVLGEVQDNWDTNGTKANRDYFG